MAKRRLVDDQWERTTGGLIVPRRGVSLPTRRWIGWMGGVKDCCEETDPITCCACSYLPSSDVTITLDSAIEFSWEYTCADSTVLSCTGILEGPLLLSKSGGLANTWGSVSTYFEFDQTVTSNYSCCPSNDTDCCIPQMKTSALLSFTCPSCESNSNAVVWGLGFVIQHTALSGCYASIGHTTHWHIYYRWRTSDVPPEGTGDCWDLFVEDGSHTLPWDESIDYSGTDYGTMTLTTVPTTAEIALA